MVAKDGMLTCPLQAGELRGPQEEDYPGVEQDQQVAAAAGDAHLGRPAAGRRLGTGQRIKESDKFRNIRLGKPSLKKTIFLLTFVNKDFTPPP